MKKFRNIFIIAFLLIAPAVWMTMNVISEAKINCRVCMSFNGQQNCANAAGNNKENCVDTAKDNACAVIASGMKDSIACSQTVPALVE